jgi:hypothetical protein
MRLILDKLFRDHDALVGGRLGRWLAALVALALGAFLALAPTSTEREGSLNRLAGLGLLALGALIVLYALLCEFLIARASRLSSEEWSRQELERRIQEGVAQAAKLQSLYGAERSGNLPDTPWRQ